MTSSSHKKEYVARLGKNADGYKLFVQPGWLEAVCGEEWDVLKIANKANTLTGYFPFHTRSVWMKKALKMPPLTPHLGPVLIPIDTKDSFQSTSPYYHLIDTFFEYSDKFRFLSYSLDPSIQNMLPFYWNQGNCNVRYTYILDLKNEYSESQPANSKLRNTIHRASSELIIETTDDVDLLYNMISSTFNKQRMKVPYSINNLNRIYTYLNKIDRHNIFIAKDVNGIVRGINYLVWDDLTAYNLIMATDKQISGLGITQFLLDHSIKHARKLNLSFFDFKGSMHKGIEQVYRVFRGRLTPYYHIFKGQNTLIDLMKYISKR